MHTYRVEVYDAAGRLLVAASLRCRDDTHALHRLGELPLPSGQVVVTRGGRRLRVAARATA